MSKYQMYSIYSHIPCPACSTNTHTEHHANLHAVDHPSCHIAQQTNTHTIMRIKIRRGRRWEKQLNMLSPVHWWHKKERMTMTFLTGKGYQLRQALPEVENNTKQFWRADGKRVKALHDTHAYLLENPQLWKCTPDIKMNKLNTSFSTFGGHQERCGAWG